MYRKRYCTYIMGSLSGTLYIGVTGHLQKQLKGWSRAKKIALIESVNPHWFDLGRDWYPWMKDVDVGRDASTPLSMTERGKQ
jgi:predicted GIY-YIG superfamily endonuclease